MSLLNLYMATERIGSGIKVYKVNFGAVLTIYIMATVNNVMVFMVYIIAGPEFGNKEGYTLIINKGLYGLKSLGAR